MTDSRGISSFIAQDEAHSSNQNQNI